MQMKRGLWTFGLVAALAVSGGCKTKKPHPAKPATQPTTAPSSTTQPTATTQPSAAASAAPTAAPAVAAGGDH
ncbi:MAG TPA: hypothetical protein VF796_26630, partial [Humisphaera sp.]